MRRQYLINFCFSCFLIFTLKYYGLNTLMKLNEIRENMCLITLCLINGKVIILVLTSEYVFLPFSLPLTQQR